MTVVVADSSPLNYLVLLGSIDILYRLYGRILVPPGGCGVDRFGGST